MSEIDETTKTIIVSLCERYIQLGKERNEIKESVSEILMDMPFDEIRGKTFYTSRETKTSKRINPLKLLEKGVSEEIIDYATEKKTSEPFIKISPIKEKKAKPKNLIDAFFENSDSDEDE